MYSAQTPATAMKRMTVDDDLEEGEAGAQEVVADDGGHDDAVLSSRIPQHRWYTSIA